MRTSLLIGLCVLLLAPVRAQTVYGPGGLFVHPTASAPQAGLQANLSWFTQESNGARSRWVPASVTYSPDGRIQYGGLFVSRRAAGRERSSGGAFAKYQVIRQSVLSPGIAVSGSYLGGDVQQSSLSVVGSGRIPATTLTVHSGLQWTRRADLPVSRDGFSRFVAVEASLGKGLRLVAESGSRFNFQREPASAYGVMWSSPGGYQLGIGWVNTGRSGSHRLFIGAGITVAGNR